MRISAVDLFCGVGGLTLGLRNAGINVRAGIDLDETCAYGYLYNNGVPFITGDIREISPTDVKKLFCPKSSTLLAGCAPCQPFSNYTQGQDARKSPQWGLLYEFLRLVMGVRPDFVTMENVATLQRHTVFARFRNSLLRLGYSIDYRAIRCESYGLPQTRQRLVLIGSRHGEVKLPREQGLHKTVRETISHLPPVEHGACDPADRFHRAAKLSRINLRRIKASTPGGSWRDWPFSLRSACHSKLSGRTYTSVYGRMSWDRPSPTITTQCYGYGSGRFGHPEQDRALTLREAALLQSFPEDYEFSPPNEKVKIKAVGRMIGNAVPPFIGEMVGHALMEGGK